MEAGLSQEIQELWYSKSVNPMYCIDTRNIASLFPSTHGVHYSAIRLCEKTTNDLYNSFIGILSDFSFHFIQNLTHPLTGAAALSNVSQ